MTDVLPLDDSPFHAGEQQVQERLGVRDKIEAFAQKVVRDHLPEQHREFFARLPFVMVGAVDAAGRPWASMIPGRPGFLSSPDARTLAVGSLPVPGDPLADVLQAGTEVGVLGIEFASRRRNRLTGQIAAIQPGGFTIRIKQTFGNCPQYIQTRAVEKIEEPDRQAVSPEITRSDRFDAAARALIESADTLFIATAFNGSEGAVSEGADVSHRGGKPGFVRIEGDRSFVFPDFSGNNHFNTVGNIVLDPKAGFLFVDFETRDLLYMTGEAEIVWDGEDVQAFAGAERLIRFRLQELVRVEAGLAFGFSFGEYSPMLDLTGSWSQAAERIAADKERDTYLSYEISDAIPESAEITSFLLRRADGKTLASHAPGQFLPIRLTVPGQEAPVVRTYTVSDAPNGEYYRLSVKREPGAALVSNHLHDHARPGFRLEAMAPRGKFVLDQSSDRPVVLISAGVGITPMIAMTNFIIAEGKRTRKFRRTHFIHGARNGSVAAFGDHLRQLAAGHDSLTLHTRLSQPGDTDRLGETHDSEGQVDIALLKDLLPLDDYDFYLCGPPRFMQSLFDGLIASGVREERIHYESFGPATVLGKGPAPAGAKATGKPVKVGFSGSETEVEWTPDAGTLLELAESAGLTPEFSCRSGVCGTCATRMTCGSVDYLSEPSAPHAGDEVLICCATPRATAGQSTCGKDYGVVLDL